MKMYGRTNCIRINNKIHSFAGEFINDEGNRKCTNKHLIMNLLPKSLIVFGYCRLIGQIIHIDIINDILQIIIVYYF